MGITGYRAGDILVDCRARRIVPFYRPTVSADNFSEVRILPAGEEHLPAIQVLAGVIWREYYPGIISREQVEYMLAWMYSPEKMRAEIRSEQICYARLLVDRQMAGFAAYGPTDAPGVMKLHKLYLLPALHGRGLGRLLLQHCEGAAGRLGARRLILAVNKRNAKAIAAYQRNGFTVVDSVVGDIGKGYVMDDFIMAKELRPVQA